MDTQPGHGASSVGTGIGGPPLDGKIFLIPQMNRFSSLLFAATFRGFGVRAQVLDTYRGLDLGERYTSGKECYPCQITMGDILYFLKEEKERLGDAFSSDHYVYFMPESEGPCRFGMYNKYQRLVLDSFPELTGVTIVSPTTTDAYSLAGLMDPRQVQNFKKAGFLSLVVADILDRLLWRVRPYETSPGSVDRFMERALETMSEAFESYGAQKAFDRILEQLDQVIEQAKALIDSSIQQKPLIGLIGEIYLRSHTHANQDLIRMLEKHGAEVVNASITEWVNYVSYDGLRHAKASLRLNLRQLRLGRIRSELLRILQFGGDLLYKEFRQKQVYRRVKHLMDLPDDHKVGHLEELLKKTDLFTFDVATETCLSIGAAVEYVRQGYNGIVHVFPFNCMASTITSGVLKPNMGEAGMPYLDLAYDSSIPPGRETAIRTFMYQAHQHHRRHGRRA